VGNRGRAVSNLANWRSIQAKCEGPVREGSSTILSAMERGKGKSPAHRNELRIGSSGFLSKAASLLRELPQSREAPFPESMGTEPSLFMNGAEEASHCCSAGREESVCPG
jgi:hypothetical protein